MPHKTTEACVYHLPLQSKLYISFFFVADIFQCIGSMCKYTFMYVSLLCSVQESVYYVTLFLHLVNTTGWAVSKMWLVVDVCCIICMCKYKKANNGRVEQWLLVSVGVCCASDHLQYCKYIFTYFNEIWMHAK